MSKHPLFHSFCSILIALTLLAIVELVLTCYNGNNNTYYILKPGLAYSFNIKSKYISNVSDRVNVTINSIGARSDEITSKHEKLIIAIGGSTTECNSIDQPLSWTQVTQRQLSQAQDKEYWVGNFGKSATETHHHILQTQELLKYNSLQKADIILYLIGFNDALKSLRHPDRYLNTSLEEQRNKGFMVLPSMDLPFIKSLALYQFLKYKKFVFSMSRFDLKRYDKICEENIEQRQTLMRKDSLPNLTKQLRRYQQNIRTLISIAQDNHKLPVFITQPVLWNENLSPEQEKHLVFDLFEQNNYTPAALARLMTLFNDALIEVCKEQNVMYLDLAKEAKASWFYDDCHFNLTGNKAVSDIISRELLNVFVDNY